MKIDLKQNSTLRNGAARDQRFSSRIDKVSLASFVLLAAALSGQTVEAQTFNDASTAELDRICRNPGGLGTGNLDTICSALQAGGTTAAAGIGSQSQPSSLLISQQQLKDAQTQKERKKRPPASADVIAAQWGKFSTFLTAGATTLRHYQNPFEDGYNASIPAVTLGGGYAILNNLEVGLAFNYANAKGNYNSGGGFDSNSYTPLLYINYLPFDNAFANLALSYTRRNQTTDRFAVAGTTGGTPTTIGGITTGNFNANQYTLNFLSGYDFAIDNITIGPRVGVDVRQWEINSYHESSNTGLELRYNDQHQTSLQTTLGLFASSAHSFSFGVIVPQVNVAWVHEHANDSRIINAHFIQAADSTTGPGFFFQTENPARDWALIDVGASLLMQKGLQAFANFTTIQGNSNFESYGGNVGVRMEW
ncbi:MAG: autotransporter outer membrane beta-barrel domain-containing protein [Methylomonas sp.]|jgi:outer membrane autotransporter protein|uniref:autotransporter outer membrane beta-barrel domain-containing protein n=1 Tax=Methylomonas sp. TaxID=418 RepID=UPI0025DF6C23|nr:autotransporter outer membrane beta-barrel domain-containing protein [Methylomonas sp.]MCK9606803.1 autotransporter outer membrane beta-barrel domain-containing protein [Methylomonas sp.]